jgi:hypothetical protein
MRCSYMDYVKKANAFNFRRVNACVATGILGSSLYGSAKLPGSVGLPSISSSRRGTNQQTHSPRSGVPFGHYRFTPCAITDQHLAS